jgi:class 3 adenylate cyclase
MPRKSTTEAVRGEIGEKQCVVLYARVRDGVSAEEGYAIRDTLNAASTIGWWFLNPGSFVAVFAGRESAARQAAACEAALRALIQVHPALKAIGVGIAEGAVLASFTGDGILETLPVGNVVSRAMEKAENDAV